MIKKIPVSASFCVCVCVRTRSCIQLYHVGNCGTTTTIQIQHCSITMRLPHIILRRHSSPPTLSSPTLGNHDSVFHVYNFVISNMLNKWDNSICNFWELGFFFPPLNLISLRPISNCSMYQLFVPFSC